MKTRPEGGSAAVSEGDEGVGGPGGAKEGTRPDQRPQRSRYPGSSGGEGRLTELSENEHRKKQTERRGCRQQDKRSCGRDGGDRQ